MTGKRPQADTVTGRSVGSLVAAVAATLLVTVSLAGCGSSPRTTHGSGKAEIDPKLGVAPSPRVVKPGEPVPKGGGRAMVGTPYKVAGKRYTPRLDPSYRAVGLASWYGDAFHGRRTANGEVFDSASISAAHPTMPLPSYARVTSLTTGRSIVVRVNDRGPFHSNRVLDMSRRAAEMLGVRQAGIAKVQVEYVGPAPVEGDDTRFLMASYRGPNVGAPERESLPETLVASVTSLPGVLVRGITGGDEPPKAAAAPRVQVASTAAPVARTPARAAAPAAAPILTASLAEDATPVVRTAVLPQPRPAVIETYAVVASADPAAVAAPIQVAMADPVQLPVVQAAYRPAAAPVPVPAAAPAAATYEPAAEAPVAYQPAAATAQPSMVFQVGPQPVLPQPAPSGRTSYAADRIDAAYAAVDDVGAGVGLADLTRSLGELSAAKVPATSGVLLQVGMFRDPANAARIAAALGGVGAVAVDDVVVNGATLKRVRVSAAAGLSAADAVAAAEKAGARGVVVLR